MSWSHWNSGRWDFFNVRYQHINPNPITRTNQQPQQRHHPRRSHSCFKTNTADHKYIASGNDTMSSSSGGYNVTPGSDSQATVSHDASEASGVSAFAYFFTTWMILLLLIASLTALVILRNRRRRHTSSSSSQDEGEGLFMVSTTTDQNPTETTTTPSAIERYTKLGFVSILVIGAIVGLGLAIFSILSCDFLHFEEALTLDHWGSNGDVTSIEFYSLGLWAVALSSDSNLFLHVADDGGGDRGDMCLEVSGVIPMGWRYKLARASAVIASALGGLSILVLLVVAATTKKGEEMASYKRCMTRFWTWSFALATCFQLLTLVLFRTPYCDRLDEESNCELSLGGVCSITAAIYWLFCAVAVSVSFPASGDK
eukprot:scaffold16300_cov150-Cylindrotheca_fusiformis.AAC.3